MTTLSQAYPAALARRAYIKKRDEFIEKLMPRRCMVVSVGLIFAGMSIPPTQLVPGLSGFRPGGYRWCAFFHLLRDNLKWPTPQ
jgi:hypothetical protein